MFLQKKRIKKTESLKLSFRDPFLILTLLFLTFGPNLLNAEEISISKQLQEKSLTNRFHFAFNTFYNTDFNPSRYAGHNESLSFEFIPAFEFPNSYNHRLGVGFTQALSKDEQREVSKIEFVSSTKIIEISNTTSLGGAVIVKVPVSEIERKNDSLKLGVGASFNLTKDLSEIEDLKGFSVSLGQSFIRSFHQYATKASGGSNARYTSIQKINLSYCFRELATLVVGANYFERLNYKNQRLKNRFSFMGQASLKLEKKLDLIMAYGINGEATKPNGRDSAISVYDSDKSAISIGIEYTL